jgi:hypothetical protein
LPTRAIVALKRTTTTNAISKPDGHRRNGDFLLTGCYHLVVNDDPRDGAGVLRAMAGVYDRLARQCEERVAGDVEKKPGAI